MTKYKYVFGCFIENSSFVFLYDRKYVTQLRQFKDDLNTGHTSLIYSLLVMDELIKKGWTEMIKDDIVKITKIDENDYENIGMYVSIIQLTNHFC